MNEPIRQHYVPQTYLKNFAKQKNHIWEIEVKDKKNNKRYLSDVRNVAFQKHMYTIDGTIDPYRWEKYFADKIEPLMAHTYNTIIQRCSSVLLSETANIIDSDLQGKLMDIIWSQTFRTPKGMEYIGEMGNSELSSLLDETKQNLSGALSDESQKFLDNFTITDEVRKEILMRASQAIDRGEQVKQLLLSMTWILYKIPKSDRISFHTSDNPVCIDNITRKNSALFEIGISDPNTIIFYPISPQVLLAIYAKEYSLKRGFGQYNGRCQRLNLDVAAELINAINRLIDEKCTQHTFCYPTK